MRLSPWVVASWLSVMMLAMAGGLGPGHRVAVAAIHDGAAVFIQRIKLTIQ